MTRWATDVSPDNVLPEYPRPQMKREDWLNLNGIWNVGVVPRGAECAADMGDILVPFPIESALSGVKQPRQTNFQLHQLNYLVRRCS